MEKEKNIFRMASVLVFRMLSGLIIFVTLARELGVEQFGRFTYWIAVSGIVLMLVNFGFNLKLLKDIPRSQKLADVLLMRALFSKLMLLFPAVLLLSIVIFIRQSDWPYYMGIVLVFISELLFTIAETINTALRALGHFGREARLSFVVNVFHLVLVVLVAVLTKDFTMIALAYVLSRTLFLIATAFLFLNQWAQPIRFKWNFRSQIKNIRSSISFASDSFLTNIYQKVDIFILDIFLGVSAVGIYQASSKIYRTLLVFSGAITNVFLPRLSSLNVESDHFRSESRKFFLFLFVYGVLFCLILTFFSEFLTDTLFGAEFASVAELFPLFGMVLLFRCIASAGGGILTVLGYQGYRVIVNLLSLAVLVVSSLILIPVQGVEGLVYSLVLSNLSILMAYALRLARIV